MSVVDVIRHYQRSIEKCQEDEERMLHCINKLCRLPITVQLLKETGVGRTVNALRKFEGQVGEAAKYTVMKWKQMVAEEESTDEDGEEAGDDTGTEMHTEENDETNAVDEEEEDGDSGNENVLLKENNKHSHKGSHSKSRKDDNYKTDSNRHEYKSSKDKAYEDVTSRGKKLKDSHKSQESNNMRDKHSHKRKRESSKNHRRDEKRKKYESENENLSGDDSESQEMQIDEQVTDAVNAECYMDEEQEEEEKEEDDDDDEDDDSNGVNDCDSRLLAPSHGSHSKQHSTSSTGSHHNKHHKESHRKHDKHKEKKVHSSDKHNRKSDSDKLSERTSSSDNKEKHSKHKDHKYEHKNNKHKDSNSTGELKKEKSENVKQKTDSVLRDSNSSKTDSKKKDKEKTDSASKTNSSHKHHKSSDTKPKEVKEKKIKKPDCDDDVGGISSMSGASFAEALGMVDPMIKKKPTNTSGSSSHSKTARSSSSKASVVLEKSSSKRKEMKPPKAIPSTKDEPASLLSSTVKLEPLKVDLDATLPEISPNYRPLPHPALDAMPHKKIKVLSDEEALAQIMSQKNQRTKVYSGMKSGKSWSSVPTLFDICVRVLQENIDAIEYTGGVPYDLLKPVLNIATPDQLFMLEHYNAYLIEETDELWEFHCKKSFRTKEREEMETWRDMYVRCVEEREAKLKALTSNIQQSIAKSTPVRQTKLAYVDSIAKPPRNVAKQQAKYGTAGPVIISKGSPTKGPRPGIGLQNSAPSTSTAVVPVAPPRGVQSVAKVKPRMAPLMQKTMKLVKSFKR